MRKVLFSLATMLMMTGLVLAAEVTVKSYDKEKKEVVVTDADGKDATYKISDKTKVTVTDKDGNATDGKVEDLEKRLSFAGKGGKGGKGRALKLDITTEGESITAVKMRAGGMKKKD